MHQLLPSLDLSAFSIDYQYARGEFLKRAQALPKLGLVEHIHHRHPEPGPDGKPLYADWLLLSKTANPSKLLVLVSGTHGVEGFVGSAIQCDLLGSGVAELLEDESLAILMIHALNPWGFAWLRRCDHEGIDLNRNFIDFKGGLPNNGSYATMHRLLSQSAESVLNGHTPLSLDAITRGQYQYPQGLYFGGHSPSWSRQWLDSRKHSAIFTTLKQIAVIDLHSGLGSFGYGEVISDHPRQTTGFELARNWYGANAMSSELGESVSAPKTGLMDFYWHKLLGERGCFVTLEFGTYSDREMIDVLIDEQSYFRRCRDAMSARDLTDPSVLALRDFFYPTGASWQQAALLRARQIIDMALKGLEQA
ncbi:MAG: hypothetical protein ACI9G5_002926 [Paracoccaceae bacterium]|jgi:hypothetical protein